MFKGQRYLSTALAAVLLTAAPAFASYGDSYAQPGYGRGDDRAYRNGYREGRKDGESDARRGRRADYDHHDEYRDADQGFHGGSKNEYRQIFRQGYAEGYNDGYRRNAVVRPGPGPVFGGDGPVFDGRGRPGPVYSSPAAANGFRDGFAQGRDDARDRRRFDPVRASRYRAGDHDYSGRYGPRDEYKREYRNGFQQGYEQGYRGGRR
jgi:hypothetical protein